MGEGVSERGRTPRINKYIFNPSIKSWVWFGNPVTLMVDISDSPIKKMPEKMPEFY